MRTFATVVGLAIAAACAPIEPVPLSNAPVNRCGCEAYGPGSDVTCNATTNRCEQPGRPTFEFFVVAHVPDSAYYAAAQTFVLYSGPGAGAPTFTRRSTATAPTICTGETCAELGGMTLVASVYRVSASQSARVGFALPDEQLIPARVEYEPVANPVAASVIQPDFPAGLPIESRLVAPRLGVEGAETSTTLPSGAYRRFLYPEPPFDALFPPRARGTTVLPDGTVSDRIDLPPPAPPRAGQRPADFAAFIDRFDLTDASLDPLDTRGVTVQREEGLDGWQIWVADRSTKRRISTLKTLSGTAQTLTLETSGERRAANGGLGDNVEVVVAPPSSHIGIPRFINPVNGGDLGTIRYPSVNAPVRVRGNVVQPDRADLGFPARLSFESTRIATRGEPDGNPLLHYSTSLSTDNTGGFATVLPPGSYEVTIEPLPGTGFAKFVQTRAVNVPRPGEAAAILLQPPRLTDVRGRVVLADGRPVAEADILATPRTPASRSDAKPRPNLTRADREGRFSLELDQGPYIITAIPKPGTGFPRVAIPSTIPSGETELPEIRIPAPTQLRFTLRDARSQNENPVANAVVRVFTVPAPADTSDPTLSREAIEIGIGTTDANGQVEILLAPGPD